MNALLIIVGLWVAYQFLMAQQAAQSSTINNNPATGQPGVNTQTVSGSGTATGGSSVAYSGFSLTPSSNLGPGLGSSMIGSSIGIGAGVASSSTNAIGSAVIGTVGAGIAGAIPIVGAVASAIFSGLMAASAKRAAEAKNENSAVANEVPPWDAGIQQIVQAFNSGQITAQEAYSLLASPQTSAAGLTTTSSGALWQAYWQVVCPQVQPGRNACNCGQAPHSPPTTHCSGNYGAGCCVAYDDLDNGQLFVAQAIQQASNSPGTPVTSQMIPTVVASQFGGINRPGYTVQVMAPSSSGSSNIFQL